jgi:hypothetical protein
MRPARAAKAEAAEAFESLTLAPSEDKHLIYDPRGSGSERLAVGRYLIGDQLRSS